MINIRSFITFEIIFLSQYFESDKGTTRYPTEFVKASQPCYYDGFKISLIKAE